MIGISAQLTNRNENFSSCTRKLQKRHLYHISQKHLFLLNFENVSAMSKNVYLGNSATFTEKNICVEVESCKPPAWHFIKKVRLRDRWFPETFAKILGTFFLWNCSGWLILNVTFKEVLSLPHETSKKQRLSQHDFVQDCLLRKFCNFHKK